MALIFVAVENGLESGAGIWGYIFLTAGRGLPGEAAGVAVAAYWAMMFAGRAVLGPLAERAGAGRILAIAVAGVPVGAALMTVPGPGALAVTGLIILGLAAAPVFPLFTLTTAQRTAAADVTGTVSLQVAASAVGGAAVPAGLGLAIGAFDARVLAPVLLVLGLAMCSLYLAAAFRAQVPGRGVPRAGRLGSARTGRRPGSMSEGQVRGLWAPQRRALTAGLILTITFVASEALAVVTVMPVVARDLGGLRLYGWVFSSFMLGSVVGIVAAGREADRRGPAVPFVAGVLLFGSGLAVAGLAPSMEVLIAGRVLQGLGAGAVPSVAYAVIGRTLTGPLRARMMAVLSTAWVAPGLAGPALSAEVARLFGWRWVFLGLLPIVAVAGSIPVPALIRLGPPGSVQTQEHRLSDGIRTAAGTAMVLAGLTAATGSADWAIPAAVALVVAGAAVGLPALRRLVPAGTLTAHRGLPATIASRGLLTFAFFGADAYVTLGVTVVRHYSTVVAGVAVTGATLGWTAGSWVQARLNDSWEGRRLIRAGLVVILAGMAGMVVTLQPSVPIAVGLVAWTVAGTGMGLAYAPLSLMMLQEAPPGHEGQASASLNLTDVLGTAIGIGVGGAAVAAESGRNLHLGITAAFAAAAVVALLALAITRRLPGTTGAGTASASGADISGADSGGGGAGTAGEVPDLDAGTTARSEK